MKVILLKDVPKIGKKYDIKNVADGFALNMLIPQGKAQIATEQHVKRINELKAQIEAEHKIQEDLLMKNLNQIDKKEIEIKAKANEQGHLFAQIHKAEIVHAIKTSIGADINEDHIDLPKAIKETGEHLINIKVGSKKGALKITIQKA